MKDYEPKDIELKWQKVWADKKLYEAKEGSDKPKYYSLVEFPYPSGEGLHVGHPRPYIGMDIISRKRRMQGFNVLYPIGYDAFGLPTENYALKTGRKPADITTENIINFRRQIQSLAISFDWSREVNTTDPKYYKWTQWLFLKFLEHGLAYKAKQEINWCPKDKIGLANEEVVDGKCERCGTKVEKREKEQWMLAITKYAERLDKDLDDVDYPERVKAQQRNWIGKSEGAEIDFEIISNAQPNYVLLHGYTGSPDANFFPWLKSELEKTGAKVQVPKLPNSDDPNALEQVEFVLKDVEFDENTILVGHSFGGVVSMKVLERLEKPIKKTVLVCSFTENRFITEPFEDKAFDWKFDADKIKANAGVIEILSDTTDDTVSTFQADNIKNLIGGNIHTFKANEPHASGVTEDEVLKYAKESITVFTTRPDTIFGATFIAVAPEVSKRLTGSDFGIINSDDRENKEKLGADTGLKAKNPASGEEMPVWVVNYVSANYGTGAIMGVPAHDERDNEFAKKYDLPIKQVVAPYFEDFTKECHPQADKSKKERRAVVALVKHWSEDKYICLQWKKLNWRTLVTGGMEDGETIEDAVKRELLEETGYKNIKSIQEFPERIVSYFFAPHKDLNMMRDGSFVVVNLADGDKIEINEEEQGKHEVVWKDKDEVLPFLDFRGDEYDSRDVKYFLGKIFGRNEEPIYTGNGVLINSGDFNYRSSEDAKEEIIKLVGGKKKITFKLRDWIFSRQRYWGEPIPVIHCEKCALSNPAGQGIVPVPEKDLPVLLPDVEKYEPTDSGESPLANISEWVNVKCPKCGGDAKRETDTMPNWAGSSWYFLRYTDPHNNEEFASQEALKHWTPVDWYNGGMEHTTLHLLYSRFWNKFFFDIGLVPTSEPYKKRTSHGFILAENGEKMSKSRGNVVNPDEIVEMFGADTLRVYEMFMGPFEQAISWNEAALVGPRRFLEKVWKLQSQFSSANSSDVSSGEHGQNLLHKTGSSDLMHATIKKASEDIETLGFNTAISSLMIWVNELDKRDEISKEEYIVLLKLLAPFAPHITEELWAKIGGEGSVHEEAWPGWDESKLVKTFYNIAVQVNGKLRATFEVSSSANEDEVKTAALALPEVEKWLNGAIPKKVIVVLGKIVNIVV